MTDLVFLLLSGASFVLLGFVWGQGVQPPRRRPLISAVATLVLLVGGFIALDRVGNIGPWSESGGIVGGWRAAAWFILMALVGVAASVQRFTKSADRPAPGPDGSSHQPKK